VNTSNGTDIKAETSHALVALDDGGNVSPARPRASAAFLAQLIGAAQNVPQARERRRAAPAEAAAAYLKTGRCLD
jgi:hypothetical protein